MGMWMESKIVTVHGAAKPGRASQPLPARSEVRTRSAPYDVVKGWPKDISSLPGNEKWTWGAGQSIYAESPNRIYLLFRGELPNIKRP